MAKIKSSAFVHNSDDEEDEERDKEFFARELALRRQIEEMHASGSSTQELLCVRKAYKEASVLDDNLFVSDDSDDDMPPVSGAESASDTDRDLPVASSDRKRDISDIESSDSNLAASRVGSSNVETTTTSQRSTKRKKIILDSDDED
jgi:replication fork protection complex subunit Tof1/Swi1